MAIEFSDRTGGHTGAMIALVPSDQDAARLAMPDGEPVEELHVTLCYLGDAADWDIQERLMLAAEVARAVEMTRAPVTGDAFAVAYFNSASEDKETALVYLVGGEDVERIHSTVAMAAGNAFGPKVPDQRKPWAAHVTATYTDDLDAHRGLIGNLGRITFDRVRVAFGGQVYDIPLEAEEPLGEEEPGEEQPQEPMPLGQLPRGEGLGDEPAIGTGEFVDQAQTVREIQAQARLVDVDMPGLVAAMGVYAPVRWHGPLAPIGSPTGDRRIFPPDTLTQATFPQPLRFQRVGLEGHKGAVVVASITHAQEGTWEGRPHIVGEGYFLDPEVIPEVAQALHLVANGVSGPSVDLDSFTAAVGEYAGKPVLVVQEARQRAATLVAIPAFADLRLTLEYPEEPLPEAEGLIASAEYFTRRAECDVQVDLEYELWRQENPDADVDAQIEQRNRLIGVTNFTNTTDALSEGITLTQLANVTHGASLSEYPDLIDRCIQTVKHQRSLAAGTEWCRPDGTLDLNALAAEVDPANASPEVQEFLNQSILDGLMIHRPGEDPQRVEFATTRTDDWRSAPIAPRSSTFDADDAVKRIQAWAGIGTEDEDEAKFRSMFLWAKPDQLDEDNVPLGSAGYRLPWGDIFDGKPYLVYHAVYAAAALLEGGHGGLPNIPDSDKAQLRNTITKIYARFSEAFDDPAVRASWDAREEAAVMELETFAARFAPLYPSEKSFAQRDLEGPTKPVITADGEYYGHMSLWKGCHMGHSANGICVKPVHSKKGYEPFYTGTVMTEEGTLLRVGKIMGDGDHAGTRGLTAAQVKKYYENTAKVFGIVRLYKDRWGIQFSGVTIPEVTAELAQNMRRSEISPHWHPIDGHLELVAAIAVNRPAFGITASAATEDLVVDESTIVLVEDGVQTGLIASAVFSEEAVVATGTEGEDCGCGGSDTQEKRVARIMALEPIPTHAELRARQARLSAHLNG